jgi:hypothetical protein
MKKKKPSRLLLSAQSIKEHGNEELAIRFTCKTMGSIPLDEVESIFGQDVVIEAIRRYMKNMPTEERISLHLGVILDMVEQANIQLAPDLLWRMKKSYQTMRKPANDILCSIMHRRKQK